MNDPWKREERLTPLHVTSHPNSGHTYECFHQTLTLHVLGVTLRTVRQHITPHSSNFLHWYSTLTLHPEDRGVTILRQEAQ